MAPITIYTKKTCAPCSMVKKLLTYKNVNFEEKDVELTENMAEAMNLSGMSMVPIIKIGDNVISGYQPAQILQLIK